MIHDTFDCGNYPVTSRRRCRKCGVDFTDLAFTIACGHPAPACTDDRPHEWRSDEESDR